MKIRTVILSLAVLFCISFVSGCTVEEKSGADSIKEIKKKAMNTNPLFTYPMKA